jgi:hypothetical protein
MAIVVEDGSIVAGANSYITSAQYAAILDDFGLFDSTGCAESNLKSAAQYLETFRTRYHGQKVSGDQRLQWPRRGVWIDGFYLLQTIIPEQLKIAQALMAYALSQGQSAFNNSAGKEIISQSVDVISVTYSDTGAANAQPMFGQVEAQLAPLMRSGMTLQVCRA